MLTPGMIMKGVMRAHPGASMGRGEARRGTEGSRLPTQDRPQAKMPAAPGLPREAKHHGHRVIAGR